MLSLVVRCVLMRVSKHGCVMSRSSRELKRRPQNMLQNTQLNVFRGNFGIEVVCN